jgi:hypothetical protein
MIYGQWASSRHLFETDLTIEREIKTTIYLRNLSIVFCSLNVRRCLAVYLTAEGHGHSSQAGTMLPGLPNRSSNPHHVFSVTPPSKRDVFQVSVEIRRTYLIWVHFSAGMSGKSPPKCYPTDVTIFGGVCCPQGHKISIPPPLLPVFCMRN